MKLSQWAKTQGISYRTAYQWFKDGVIKEKTSQTSTGTILVFPNENTTSKEKYIIYARVSSRDQIKDLQNQLNRVKDFAAKQGLKIENEYSEIGSGLNGKRKKLLNILEKTDFNIIVEHKDRLCRFGFEMIESCLKQSGRKIIVVNNSDLKDDLVQDFIDLATSMCAKIYGKRSAKNKALKAFASTKE